MSKIKELLADQSIDKNKLTQTIMEMGVENFTTQELDIILSNQEELENQVS